MAKLLVLLLAAVLPFLAWGHPTATFGIHWLALPTIAVGENVTLTFALQDLLHNLALVRYEDLMPMHDRYLHILFVSQDGELAAHIHPDDFYNPADSSLALNTTFWVQIAFPRGGIWSIAMTFLYQNFDQGLSAVMREGFAQITINVTGTPGPNPNPTYNCTQVNYFNTYAIGADEIFLGFIDINANVNPLGFPATMQLYPNQTSYTSIVGLSGASTLVVPQGENVGFPAGICSPVVINVFANDSQHDGAPLVPYLASAVHFTMFSPDNAVYHAHGTYLPAGTSWADVITIVQNENMMGNISFDFDMNLTINAMMAGVQMNDTLDCRVDMGQVMMMMPFMDMTKFYGPKTFGPTIVGLFDFPLSGNWRVFAYMKAQFPDGEQRLIVPTFSVNSYHKFTFTTGEFGSASNFAPSIFLAIIAAVVYLLF